MKLFVVTHLVGGFAREDDPLAHVACAVQNPEVARLVAFCVRGTIHEVEVDLVPEGYKQQIKAYGLKFPNSGSDT